MYWVPFHLLCILSITDAMRLYRNGVADTSQSWSSGIVQIYYSGSWGNICYDSSFGPDEADVICHQLSYTGASSYSNTGTTTIWGTDSSSTILADVSCSSSSYLTITQCSFNTIISTSRCMDSTDVTVTCYTTRIWDSPLLGDIRLTGGTYSNQGLLEVYCNGQWGTVCDNSFSDTEATVACKQLGYNQYVDYDHLTFQINASQSIWLNTVDSCSSTDTCLIDCGSCPLSAITTCTHRQDVTLECRYNPFISTTTDATSTTNCFDKQPAPAGTIRFFRNGLSDASQSWSSGIVQLYYYDSRGWGNICDDGFGSDEADVTCHQLGYTGASSYSNTGTTAIWGTDHSSTIMSDVTCSSSSYLTITQCSFCTLFCDRVHCGNENDVVISCYSTRIWDSPFTGDIRLTGGRYSNQGLLEVYCNGEWGTVCDEDFSSTQSEVACRQLGYNDYQSYNRLSIQGTPSQSIWLHYLSSCSFLSDYCLTSCGSCPSSAVTVCDHSQDATLVCEYNLAKSSISTMTDACNTDVASAGIIAGSVIGLIVCLLVVIVSTCLCVCIGVRQRSGTRSGMTKVVDPPTSCAVEPTIDTSPPQAAACYYHPSNHQNQLPPPVTTTVGYSSPSMIQPADPYTYAQPNTTVPPIECQPTHQHPLCPAAHTASQWQQPPPPSYEDCSQYPSGVPYEFDGKVDHNSTVQLPPVPYVGETKGECQQSPRQPQAKGNHPPCTS